MNISFSALAPKNILKLIATLYGYKDEPARFYKNALRAFCCVALLAGITYFISPIFSLFVSLLCLGILACIAAMKNGRAFDGTSYIKLNQEDKALIILLGIVIFLLLGCFVLTGSLTNNTHYFLMSYAAMTILPMTVVLTYQALKSISLTGIAVVYKLLKPLTEKIDRAFR